MLRPRHVRHDHVEGQAAPHEPRAERQQRRGCPSGHLGEQLRAERVLLLLQPGRGLLQERETPARIPLADRKGNRPGRNAPCAAEGSVPSRRALLGWSRGGRRRARRQKFAYPSFLLDPSTASRDTTRSGLWTRHCKVDEFLTDDDVGRHCGSKVTMPRRLTLATNGRCRVSSSFAIAGSCRWPKLDPRQEWLELGAVTD